MEGRASRRGFSFENKQESYFPDSEQLAAKPLRAQPEWPPSELAPHAIVARKVHEMARVPAGTRSRQVPDDKRHRGSNREFEPQRTRRAQSGRSAIY